MKYIIIFVGTIAILFMKDYIAGKWDTPDENITMTSVKSQQVASIQKGMPTYSDKSFEKDLDGLANIFSDFLGEAAKAAKENIDKEIKKAESEMSAEDKQMLNLVKSRLKRSDKCAKAQSALDKGRIEMFAAIGDLNKQLMISRSNISLTKAVNKACTSDELSHYDYSLDKAYKAESSIRDMKNVFR